MTVEHDLENFGEGRDVIMTLKDSKILDEESGKAEGDTLVNVNMVDNERAKVCTCGLEIRIEFLRLSSILYRGD